MPLILSLYAIDIDKTQLSMSYVVKILRQLKFGSCELFPPRPTSLRPPL